MALYYQRIRRALYVSYSLLKQQDHHKPLSYLSSSTTQNHHRTLVNLPFQSRHLRSSTVPLRGRFDNDLDADKIGSDSILFEGCDYNHWLITIDFPKDPKPTPEEMVETYVQTAAKVVGSVEEAKKRIYACSTTTYEGFQLECSEEMSEKFRGLPGVVFILPDSYIDPVNKEYGGDKYINGTIIPRPPPVHYGRQGRRYNDGNRDFNRQNRARNFGPQQNYGPPGAQQNFPPQQNYGRPGSQQNFPPQQNYGPPGSQQNFPPQQNYGPPASQQNFLPQQNNRPPQSQQNLPSQQNYGQPGGPGSGQRTDPMSSYQPNYDQGDRGNYYPQGQRDFPQADQRGFAPRQQRDFRGDNQNYAPPQGGSSEEGGTYVQGSGGTYGQGVVGVQGQGMGTGYGQGDDQRFSQMEPRNNMQG